MQEIIASPEPHFTEGHGIAVPSPAILATHAALARILIASGIAECIIGFEYERESVDAVNPYDLAAQFGVAALTPRTRRDIVD